MSMYLARSPYRIQSRLFFRPRRRTLYGVSRKSGSLRGAVNLRGSINKIKAVTMKLEFGPSMAIVGLLLIAVLFILLYLAHFNQVATKGYDLRRLEADRQNLLDQYDIKNMKLAEAKSLATIIASDKVSAMRRPSEVSYVRGNTVIASR